MIFCLLPILQAKTDYAHASSHLKWLEACAESNMFLAAKGIMGRPSLMLGLDVGSMDDGGAIGDRSPGTTVPRKR
jgi:hypothetical protein